MSEIWTSHKLTEVSFEKHQSPVDKQLLQQMDAALKKLASARWGEMKSICAASRSDKSEAILGGVLYEQEVKDSWLCGTIGINLPDREDSQSSIDSNHTWVIFSGHINSNKEDGGCWIRGIYGKPETVVKLIDIVNQHWNSSPIK